MEFLTTPLLIEIVFNSKDDDFSSHRKSKRDEMVEIKWKDPRRKHFFFLAEIESYLTGTSQGFKPGG